MANSKIPETIYKLALKNKLTYSFIFHHLMFIKMEVINELSKLIIQIYTKIKITRGKSFKKISNNLTKLLIIRPCNLFWFPFDKM